jgi:hypothetical protein
MLSSVNFQDVIICLAISIAMARARLSCKRARIVAFGGARN